jgi:predicted small lipoprotein YifL
MTRRTACLFPALALLASFGCGKKGPILPPFVRVPQTVQDLSLSRVGNRALLSWTNPDAYIDGNPLQGLSEVEIWVVEEAGTAGTPPAKPAQDEIEDRGRLLLKVPAPKPASPGEKEPPPRRLSVSLEPDPGEMARNFLFFSLRARDGKKRPSEFSDPAVLEPGLALPTPAGIKAGVFEKHIEICWSPPAETADAGPSKIAGYNVYRSEGEGPPARLNSDPLAAPKFRDESFSFGKIYVYFVRSAGPGAPGGVESEDSGSIKVEPVDKFPPAAPQGLSTISGDGLVALSWEPAREADLAGYRVWRRAAGQTTPVLLKELSPAESSFSDAEVENNKQYVYSITAFDRAGNESGRSAEASGQARRPRD